jgi:hypothetical protein
MIGLCQERRRSPVRASHLTPIGISQSSSSVFWLLSHGSCVRRTRHPFAVSGLTPSPKIELWFGPPASKQVVGVSRLTSVAQSPVGEARRATLHDALFFRRFVLSRSQRPS